MRAACVCAGRHAALLGFFFSTPRVSLALVVFCAVTQQVDYLFAENGLVAYKNGELLSVQVNTILSTGLVEHLNLVPILLVRV